MTPATLYAVRCMLPAWLFLLPAAGAQHIFQRITGDGGNDKAWSVLTQADGTYLLTGWTTGNWGAEDIMLCKSDSSGNLLWTHLYGGSLVDFGMDVNGTRDGGFIIAGYGKSQGAGDDDIYLIRTNAAGKLLWAKTYGGPGKEVGYAVQETSDGGFIVCGSTQSFGMGSNDMYLVRTDSAGNRLWSRTMGHSMSDFAYWVRETADSSFIVAGAWWLPGGSSEAYLARFSAAGSLLWSKVYSTPGSEVAREVTLMKDGGFLLSGSTSGTGSYDGYLLRTDAAGNKLWELAVGGTGFEQFESAVETSSGMIVAAGNTQDFTDRRLYAAGVDSAGNLLWTRAYFGAGANFGRRVRECADGTVIVAGETNYPSSINILTVKMLPDGNAVCDTAAADATAQPASVVSDTVTHVLIPADTVIAAMLLDTAWTFSDTVLCDSVVSPPVSVRNPAGTYASGGIYPNPASASVTVTGGPGLFALSDAAGRTALRRRIADNTSAVIDLRDLRPGIYFYRFIGEHGDWRYGKLLVMGDND